MYKTFKYRLYPNKTQEAFLNLQLREACDLYNCALQERRDAWKTCRKSITRYHQQRELTGLRKEGLVGIVNCQCAQDVLHRLENAFQSFFRRVKLGGTPGYPRFKSIKRYDSITFPEHGNGCKLLPNGRLRVQGAGKIRVKLHRAIEGNIKSATIKRDIDRWYVCFSVEFEPQLQSGINQSVGVDVGLRVFATLSDGTEIANPRHFNHSAASIRRRQRRLARRKKTSKRRAKARTLVAKAYRKVRNQRENFHHNVSRWLVDRYGVIAVEDLNVKGMAKGMLAKSVNDAGWSAFLIKLSYKAEDAGRTLVKVNPRGTSQTCLCGAPVPKTLMDRWHECSVCGLSAGRDHVSAQVILQRARNWPSSVNVEVVNSCVA